MTEASDEAKERLGQVVGGRFELRSILGVGGFGAVYEAHDGQTGSTVALKVLHPELAQSREVVVRFEREALAASKIGHPGIVRVLAQGKEPLPWFAMEKLEGRDAGDVLREEGPMVLGRAVRLVRAVCDALHAAHQAGIVHRDLKLDNIFLEGPEQTPKLLDFGVSKFLEVVDGQSLMTRTGTAVGTPYYMSPEQAQGKKTVGAPADIYALGVILFELLTAQRPFEDESYPMLVLKICTEPPPAVSIYRDDVPAAFAKLIERCLDKEASNRFASAAELSEALAPYADADQVVRLRNAPRTSDSRAKALGTAPTALSIDPHTGQPLARDLEEEADRAADSVRKGGMGPWIVIGVLALAAVAGVTAFLMRAPEETAESNEWLPVRLPSPGIPVIAPLSAPAPTELGWRWENPRPRAMPTWRDVEVASSEMIAMVGPGGRAAKLTGSQLTWWATGTRNDLNGLAFIGPAQALAVGDEGTIVALLQTGPRAIELDSTATLHDVVALGPTDALAVGAEGTVVRLQTLRPSVVDTGRSDHLFGVDEDDGVVRAVGTGGVVLRIDEAGVTVEHEGGATLRSIAHCIGRWLAVGDHGTVLRLVDDRWERVATDIDEGLTDLACDADRFAASGREGKVYLLDGERAVALESGDTLGFRGIGGGEGMATWLVGDGGRLARVDGDHLRMLTAGPVATLFDVTDLAGVLVVVGQWGTLAKTTDGRLATVETPTEVALAAVAKLEEHRLIAVGDEGQLLEVTFDSVRRHQLEGDDSVSLRDLVAGGGVLVAVGAGGSVVRGAPGAFVVERVPELGTFWGIAGTPDRALAVGDDGAVVRIEGATETRVLCPEGPTLRDVMLQTEGDGETYWAVGDGGRILRIDAEGCVAEQEASEDAPVLHAVELGPQGRPFAVGEDGAAFERGEDGSWTALDLSVGGLELRGLHRTDHDVYLVGASGLVMRHRRLD